MRTKVRVIVVVFTIFAAISWSAVPCWAQCRTFSTDADFDEGLLFNLNHNAPNGDQLQLNTVATPFPFVNIAASGRGTVIRIDVNTGQILGEYLSCPAGMGADPSRTTVDQAGNVWVANRAEWGVSGGIPKGSITRIALIIGGTRCDSDGTPNPVGDYLKPPFLYSTAIDRDGDGLIKTSRGLGDIRPWTNAGGADTHGGVSTADDECIINYVRVNSTGTRTLAIDANNDVWVGGIYGGGPDYNHELVDGVTGLPVPGSQFNLGCGGYGGLIDGNGILWSASQCSGTGLLRYDPSSSTGVCLAGQGEYGLGIDPNTGHIWHSSLCQFPRNLYEIDAAGGVVNSYPQPFDAQGVCVDGNSHVWMAELFGTRVWHLAPDPMNPGQHVAVGIVTGLSGVTGLAVDANGKIWAAEQNDRASRIDPALGAIGGGGYTIGAIDLSVNLGSGAWPYNYSDMTGFVSVSTTSPFGTWTVAYDGGAPGTNWGKICWNQDNCIQPSGSEILVRVRSSDDQVTWSAWVDVVNCEDFDVPDGQYLEVEVKLIPNADGDTPVLCDVTICTGVVPVLVDIKPSSCPNPLNVRIGGVTEVGVLSDGLMAGAKLGVVPVAILGTEDFNVMMIDPESIRLNGVAPIRWNYEDVSTPVIDNPDVDCECNTLRGDGYLDLTLKFSRDELVAALGPVIDGEYIPLELSGELTDGRVILGYDCVVIRGEHLLTAGTEAGSVLAIDNHPNPFNATTLITYQLPEAGQVTLSVFNVLGQHLATLTEGHQESGRHTVEWSGCDTQGREVSSGVYLYRLQFNDQSLSRKMLLLK